MDNWSGYKLPVARTQRVTYYFYGEKKQYLFKLRSLHLQFMKGNKIGPIKLHPINFCSKFGRSKEMNLQFMKGNKICPLKLPPINVCPKLGRSKEMDFQNRKKIDSERKTLPDWYKFSR